MDGHAVGLVELRLLGRPAQAGGAFAAAAGDADDRSAAGEVAPDQVVVGVRDNDAAVAVDAEMLRAVEGGLARIAAVAAVPRLTGADDGADLPLRVHHSQRVAAALQDVDV